MNRINPLFIIALLFIIFVFSLLQVNTVKEEFLESKALYAQTLELSSKLESLGAIYSDKKTVKKSLSRILRQRTLGSANIKQTVSSSKILLSSSKMDKIALNSLMSKIVNGSYNLTSLEIKKLKDGYVSFKMSISW